MRYIDGVVPSEEQYPVEDNPFVHVLLEEPSARVITSDFPGSSRGCAGEDDLRSATNVDEPI